MLLLIAGAAVGSFAGAAADRLERGESIAFCRSRCDSCGVALQARDLVPLASYCALHGRCRFCEANIPQKLLFIEALSISATAATLVLVSPEQQIGALLFTWLLLALSWFDYELGRLPGVATTLLGVAGLGLAVVEHMQLADHLLGAALGLALPAVVAFTYEQLRGRKGLGFGDVKMLAAVGAWVGWQGLPSVIFLASSGALAFCAARVGFVRAHSVRFGPFVAIAAWVVWVAHYGGPLS